MVAFDDPYDAAGPPVMSSRTVSPWSDLSVASTFLNSNRMVAVDVGGRAAVMSWCYSHNQCRVYSLVDGLEPAELHLAEFPVFDSVVKTHHEWFMLSAQGERAAVHAADTMGRVRLVGSYPRSRMARTDDLRLVRRSHGSGVALWLTALSADGSSHSYVFPIDTVTGELMPVQDGWFPGIGGQVPASCAPGEEGWLVELPLSTHPRLPSGVDFGSSMRMRVRVDAARACVEAITGRASENEIRFSDHQQWLAGNAVRKIPMAVWDHQGNRKFELACAQSDPANDNPSSERW